MIAANIVLAKQRQIVYVVPLPLLDVPSQFADILSNKICHQPYKEAFKSIAKRKKVEIQLNALGVL